MMVGATIQQSNETQEQDEEQQRFDRWFRFIETLSAETKDDEQFADWLDLIMRRKWNNLLWSANSYHAKYPTAHEVIFRYTVFEGLVQNQAVLSKAESILASK